MPVSDPFDWYEATRKHSQGIPGPMAIGLAMFAFSLVLLLGCWSEGLIRWELGVPALVMGVVAFCAFMTMGSRYQVSVTSLRDMLSGLENSRQAVKRELMDVKEFYGQFAPPITVVEESLRIRAIRVRVAHERCENLLHRGIGEQRLAPGAVLEVAFMAQLGDFKNQKKVAEEAFMRLAKLAQERSYAVQTSWRSYVGMEKVSEAPAIEERSDAL